MPSTDEIQDQRRRVEFLERQADLRKIERHVRFLADSITLRNITHDARAEDDSLIAGV